MPEKVHSSYKPKVIKDKDDVKNQSFWLGSGLAQDSAARNVPVTHGTIPRNKLEKEPIRNHQICSDPNPFLSGTQAQTRRLVKRTVGIATYPCRRRSRLCLARCSDADAVVAICVASEVRPFMSCSMSPFSKILGPSHGRRPRPVASSPEPPTEWIRRMRP